MEKLAGRPSMNPERASRANLASGGRTEAQEANNQRPKRLGSIRSGTRRKTGGGSVYSLDPNSTRPETCKPPRIASERLRKGIGTSKHLNHVPARLNQAGPSKVALPLRASGHNVWVAGHTSTISYRLPESSSFLITNSQFIKSPVRVK